VARCAVSAAAPHGLTEQVRLEPEVRVVQPGSDAVYAYEIYDDGLEPEHSSRLEMGRRCSATGRSCTRARSHP